MVQLSVLHSHEEWCWNEEMVDTLDGWESKNLEIMGTRNCAQRQVNLELFRANQIRMARKRFAENGGESVEYVVLHHIWRYMGKVLKQKRTRPTDQIMTNILMHVNPEWREQRSATALVLDPRIEAIWREGGLEWYTQTGTTCRRNGGSSRWW